MIHRVSVRMTLYMIRKGVGDENRYAWYVYGLEIILGKILNYSLFLLFGLCTGKLAHTLVFLLFFVLLRRFTGGYHLNKDWLCTLCSLAMLAVSLPASRYLAGAPFLSACFFVGGSAAVVFLLAPVNHPNLSLTDKELAHNRHWARLLFCIEGLAVLLCKGFGFFPEMTAMACMALAFVSITIVLSKVTKQEVQKHEPEQRQGHEKRVSPDDREDGA